MSALYLDPYYSLRSLRAEQVLEETNEYVLKARNAPVPVQVQELLRGNLDGEILSYFDNLVTNARHIIQAPI